MWYNFAVEIDTLGKSSEFMFLLDVLWINWYLFVSIFFPPRERYEDIIWIAEYMTARKFTKHSFDLFFSERALSDSGDNLSVRSGSDPDLQGK